ncbi:MAG: SRPBCC family protein [Bizionia sp.]|nr:SRPBCC family protein [Bizionia sp.]
MKLTVAIDINAPKEKVWKAITAIENSVQLISGIENIEMLHTPENTLVGLKWKETRTVFGKSATETMWITEAVELSHYVTRAESNGAIYQTTLKLTEHENTTYFAMEFSSEAVTFKGKVMGVVFGALLKKSMKKLIYKDLLDIKTNVENN